jgi:methyl-accepting chemotaxis protein
MKVTLRLQLASLGAAGIALGCVVAGMAWYGLKLVEHDIADMQSRSSMLRASVEGDMMHDAIRGDVQAYLLAKDDTEVAQAKADLDEHAQRFTTLLGEVQKLAPDDALLAASKEANEKVVAYVAAAHELMGTSRTDDEAIETQQTAFAASFSELEERMEKLSDLIETSVNEAAETAIHDPKRVLLWNFATLGVGSVCMIGVVWVISRGIMRRTTLIAQALSSMKAGDLRARTKCAGRDELALVAQDIDATATSISQLVRELNGAIAEVTAAATEISASSEEMARGLAQQEQQATQVSAAVEQMATSVREVSQKSSDAASAAKESQEDATSGASVVKETVGEIEQIADNVRSSSQSVNALGAKSEQIGAIIKVINDIADQTNLLALNAAIEAARAGEHGRGFAVVADEVRKLAERTTKATEEVGQSIREIQDQTKTAVTLIEGGAKRVARGVELASNAGQALGRINQSSQGLAGMVTSIAAATEEQSAASEQISKSVEGISSVTKESSQAAGQMSQAAASLSQQGERLKMLVERFKV